MDVALPNPIIDGKMGPAEGRAQCSELWIELPRRRPEPVAAPAALLGRHGDRGDLLIAGQLP